MLYVIDGYNLLFYLYPTVMQREDMEATRVETVRRLESYAALENFHIWLVFDAPQNTKAKVKVDKKSHGRLQILYGNLKKREDSLLEHVIWQVRSTFPNEPVTVVSSDFQVQKVALGASVLRLSAREFNEILSKCEKTLANEKKEGRIRFIVEAKVDPEVRAKLERLRRGGH